MYYEHFESAPQQLNNFDCGLFAVESIVRLSINYRSFIEATKPIDLE
jgi:hypothetical protein